MIASSRMIASRFAAATISPSAIPASSIASRTLSTQASTAADKLRNALEEYRSNDCEYSRCLPSRFRKEIIKAAKNDSQNDTVELAGMQRLISNIQMTHKVSPKEVETLFTEVGNGPNKTIPADKLMRMIA